MARRLRRRHVIASLRKNVECWSLRSNVTYWLALHTEQAGGVVPEDVFDLAVG